MFPCRPPKSGGRLKYISSPKIGGELHFGLDRCRIGERFRGPGGRLKYSSDDKIALEVYSAIGWRTLAGEIRPDRDRLAAVLFGCAPQTNPRSLQHHARGEAGLNHLCAGYQQFFQYVDDALRFKRATANVRASVTQQDPAWRHRLITARRSDPCPGGSSKRSSTVTASARKPDRPRIAAD